MLGGSLRNQGRYLLNWSTDGRTVPKVKLMQFLMQANEAADGAGAAGSGPQGPAALCCPSCHSAPLTPGRLPHAHMPECALRFSLTGGASLPPGNCPRLRQVGKGSLEQRDSPRGLPTPLPAPHVCAQGKRECVSARQSGRAPSYEAWSPAHARRACAPPLPTL